MGYHSERLKELENALEDADMDYKIEQTRDDMGLLKVTLVV